MSKVKKQFCDAEFSKSKSNTTNPNPILFSFRFYVVLLTFIGIACAYSQRISLSVSMICMVNHTALVAMSETPNSSEIEVASCGAKNSAALDAEDGQHIWPKYVQGISLGSFYWGYILLQIAGASLSFRFGSKLVFGISSLICLLLTVALPTAANIHYGLLVADRTLLGLSQGALIPAVPTLLAKWVPPMERSRLLGIAYSGWSIGCAVTLPLGGYLCKNGFAGGWPSLFYLIGVASFLFFIIWMIFVSDSPEDNRWISDEEKKYLISHLDENESETDLRKIPWSDLLTSLPVWAIIGSHFLTNWGDCIYFTQLPTYLKEVTGFDITRNGLTSSLSYVGQSIVTIVFAVISDVLRVRGILSTTVCRKLFNSFGALCQTLLLVMVTFMDCDHKVISATLLILGVSFSGVIYGSGFFINISDIAPHYSGIIFSLSNTMATIPGIFGPSVVAELTRGRTRAQWNNVLYATAAITAASGILYIILGSGEVQSWAKTKDGEENRAKNNTTPIKPEGMQA